MHIFGLYKLALEGVRRQCCNERNSLGEPVSGPTPRSGGTLSTTQSSPGPLPPGLTYNLLQSFISYHYRLGERDL